MFVHVAAGPACCLFKTLLYNAMQGKGRTLFDTPAAALPCLIAAVSHALPCMKTQGKARMDLGRADVKTLVEHQLEVCSDLKNTQGPLTSAGQSSRQMYR